MRIYPWILFCSVINPIISIAAPIYKWVDEAGVMHYSQTPPPQGNAEILAPQFSPPPPDQSQAPPPPGNTPRPANDNAPLSPQAEAAKRQKDAEEQTRRCNMARGRLEQLQNSRRVAVPDANGEYRHIDDNERAALIAQVEELIQQDCQ